MCHSTSADRLRSFALAWVGVLLVSSLTRAADEPPDYSLADPALKLVRLDRSEDASFVAVRCDTGSRLFVGGRETLSVYEPDERGGYLPRRELYRFPPHTWVFDIEIRGHDLYVATAAAIYVLPDAVVRREGLQARRLIWGIPLEHVQLGFFGLAWGPEGDLYVSLGDPLQHYGDFNRADHWGHWTFFSGPDASPTPYTGVGGVLHCRPDGSRLQVVARGIFRSCGLAFDRHWNLFTDDNDREAMPVQYVPARLLHVTPHAYFGWPRGWMPSKTPDRADLLETMYDGLGREAPVGLAYYDDVLLPAAYRNQLLLARWAQRTVTRHTIEPRGASFTSKEQPFVTGGERARPVGMCVGRGGRVFVTVLQMAQLEGSPSCPSDLVMITRADDPPGHPFDSYDSPGVPAAKLWAELSDPSWSRRYRAHVELLRRGGELLAEAAERLGRARVSDPSSSHLTWLAAASGTAEATEQLVRLATHDDGNVRLQAIRALGQFASVGQIDTALRDTLARALRDTDPRVRHAALVVGFRLVDRPPESSIVEQARRQDTYLRQTATLLLAERASLDFLAQLCEADDAPTRLAGGLAAGFRLTLPPATTPLPDHLPLDPFQESSCVITYADAKVDLRQFGRLGKFTVAEHWKAGKHTAEQDRLFTLLLRMLDDLDEAVRLQAGKFLAWLNDPGSEPLVAKVVTASEERRLAAVPVSQIRSIAKAWVVGPFPDGHGGLATVHPPEQGAVDLAAGYTVGNAKLAWTQVNGGHFDFGRLLGPYDHASAYAYCRLESGRRQRVLLFVGSDDGVKVWHNARLVWENAVERRALAFQDPVILDLQPGSNDLLVRVQNLTGDSGMYLHYKALGEVVATLPEKLDVGSLAERLKAAGPSGTPAEIPPSFLAIDWTKAVQEGDAARGRKLFSSDGLACAKCHAVAADQDVTGGPSLADARKRFTVAHLVESILLPSKNVSPVFRSTQIATTDGRVMSGLVVSETADHLELLLSDTNRQTMRKSDIEERRLQELSPMPQGIVKTPDELRDLLAYLLSEKPAGD